MLLFAIFITFFSANHLLLICALLSLRLGTLANVSRYVQFLIRRHRTSHVFGKLVRVRLRQISQHPVIRLIHQLCAILQSKEPSISSISPHFPRERHLSLTRPHTYFQHVTHVWLAELKLHVWRLPAIWQPVRILFICIGIFISRENASLCIKQYHLFVICNYGTLILLCFQNVL